MSVILTEGAGKTIPAEVRKHLVSTTKAFGYALLADGKILISKDLPIEQLSDYDTIFPDYNTVCYYGDEGHGQPFTLLEDEAGIPTLVAFIEGDCPDYHDTNGQSDAANFVKDYLQSKIDEMVEMVEGDLTKLSKALQKTSVAKDVTSKFGKRGTVTFMDAAGDNFSLTNEPLLSFDWGTASHPLDDKPVTAATPPADKKETTEEKLARLRAKNVSGVHPTTATSKPLNDGKSPLQTDVANADALKDSTAVPKITQDLIFPPEGACRSKSTLKDWYNAHFGTCPQGYKLGEGDHKKAVGMSRSMLLPGSKLHDQKPVAAAAANAGKTPNAIEDVVGGFPIIDSAQKQTQGVFIKNIDLKSMDIMDPKKMQEIEANASDWFDQHGETIENFMKYPPFKIRELCVKWANDAQLLIETLRYMLAVQLSRKLPAKAEEKPSTPAVSGNAVADRLAALRNRKTA